MTEAEALRARETAFDAFLLAAKQAVPEYGARWKLVDLAIDYAAAARKEGCAIAISVYAPPTKDAAQETAK